MDQEVADVDQNCMQKLLVACANAVEKLKNEATSSSASSYIGIKSSNSAMIIPARGREPCCNGSPVPKRSLWTGWGSFSESRLQREFFVVTDR